MSSPQCCDINCKHHSHVSPPAHIIIKPTHHVRLITATWKFPSDILTSHYVSRSDKRRFIQAWCKSKHDPIYPHHSNRVNVSILKPSKIGEVNVLVDSDGNITLEHYIDFCKMSFLRIKMPWKHCFVCGNVTFKEQGYDACGGCRLVCYCSTACQKLDWQTHKAICLANRDSQTIME
jgi:hypothetical protein